MEGVFVEQIALYKSTNTKIIAFLSPIVADQLWTWNILSLLEHPVNSPPIINTLADFHSKGCACVHPLGTL